MAWSWESEIPAIVAAHPDWTDQQIADAINAMTVQDAVAVFGSFRTLAALLTAEEFNTLAAALDSAAASSRYVAEMVKMLSIPGNEAGDGGGLDFTNAGFTAMLNQLCAAANLPEVPGKIAAHVAGLQPVARQKYPWTAAGEMATARGT